MTPDFANKTIPLLIAGICERLQRALASAKAAKTYAGTGGISGALEIVLDIGQPVHEANGLLNAASLIVRFSRQD
jgi:hypothetical protein